MNLNMPYDTRVMLSALTSDVLNKHINKICFESCCNKIILNSDTALVLNFYDEKIPTGI